MILARETVGTLYDSAQLYGGPAYRRALEVVRERHVHYRVARRNESFDLGPAHVRILAPELPLLAGTSSDINNNSVVLRVEFGKTAILMTGDTQSEAEARLLSHGGAELHADVLKVGHHGSRTSSTGPFLEAVSPSVALISAGFENSFGHPHPDVLGRLSARHAALLRTDLDGLVAARTDGKGLWFDLQAWQEKPQPLRFPLHLIQ